MASDRIKDKHSYDNLVSQQQPWEEKIADYQQKTPKATEKKIQPLGILVKPHQLIVYRVEQKGIWVDHAAREVRSRIRPAAESQLAAEVVGLTSRPNQS